MEGVICTRCKELELVIIKLQDKVKELERRLLKYENAHTPSSQQRRYPKREKSNNKVGAPEGHKGITREMPKPNRFKELKLRKCPDCGRGLGRLRTISRKTIIDIPDPQPLKITQFTLHHYFCAYCNKEVIPRDPELSDEGIFGPNLQAEITLMKHEERLPYEKIKASLQRRYNLDISKATIIDINRRVADKLQGTYKDIKQQVKESLQVNADETGIKVRGKQFWTWVFVTLSAVLFMIRANRGQKTIKEALGKNYKGILGCDGWKSYPTCIEIIQRCWAHLLREAEWFAEKYEGTARCLYNGLHKIFQRINKITINTTQGVRTRTYNWCIKEMRYWINVCGRYKELRKFGIKLKNGLEYWFTCVLHPEIEPTNNKAERALREIVVQRKISSLWNEKGIRMKETIMSVLGTWRLRGLNTFSILRQTLSS